MKHNCGFTLAETLIALVMGSMLLSGLMICVISLEKRYRDALDRVDQTQAVALVFHAIRAAIHASKSPPGCVAYDKPVVQLMDTGLAITHIQHNAFQADVLKGQSVLLIHKDNVALPFHRGDTVQVFSHDNAPVITWVTSVYRNMIHTAAVFDRSKAVWLADDHTIRLSYSVQEQALRLKLDNAPSRQWLTDISQAGFSDTAISLCRKSHCYVLALKHKAVVRER